MPPLTTAELREPDIVARIAPADYPRLPATAQELVRLHLVRIDRVTGEWVAELPAYRWREVQLALAILNCS